MFTLIAFIFMLYYLFVKTSWKCLLFALSMWIFIRVDIIAILALLSYLAVDCPTLLSEVFAYFIDF